MANDLDQFPKTIEVFMPLLDGVHPVVPEDINEMRRVLETLQDVLGYGNSPLYGGTTPGPKGKNKDVDERLDTFLDVDGSLRDVAFVTVETHAGAFYERTLGLFVPFGKQLVSTDYRVIYQTFSDAQKDSSAGVSIPHPHAPSWIWVAQKSRNGVRLAGRTVEGWILAPATNQKVIVQLLVFGAGSTP